MIYICPAAPEEVLLKIWHPDKESLLLQDPPAKYKTCLDNLVCIVYSTERLENEITLQIVSRPFMEATMLAGDSSWTACLSEQ